MKMYLKNTSTTFFFFFLFSFFFIANIHPQTTGLRFAWTPNNESYLSHYVMYRDTIPGTMVMLDIIPKSDSTYHDTKVEPGITYYYKLTAADSFGNESLSSNEVSAKLEIITQVNKVDDNRITTYQLRQNYPNPFNQETTITYTIPTNSWISICIYDVLGREVIKLEDSYKEKGRHQVIWQGQDKSGRQVASGIYYYQMLSQKFHDTKKLIIRK